MSKIVDLRSSDDGSFGIIFPYDLTKEEHNKKEIDTGLIMKNYDDYKIEFEIYYQTGCCLDYSYISKDGEIVLCFEFYDDTIIKKGDVVVKVSVFKGYSDLMSNLFI